MKKLLLIAHTFAFLSFCSSVSIAQWQQTNFPSGAGKVQALTVSGTNIFAGTSLGGIFLSTDSGGNWTAVNTGLFNLKVYTLATSGANLLAGTDSGVFISANNGGNWTRVISGLPKVNKMSLNVHALTVSGTTIFAGTSGTGVSLSSDNGSNWTPVNNGIPNNASMYINSLASSGTNIYAVSNGGAFFSSDNGSNWLAANTGMTGKYPIVVITNGTTAFAGTTQGVCMTTNNGSLWTSVNTGLPNTNVNALTINGTNLFAGTSNGVFLSDDDGNTWNVKNAGLTDTLIYSLAANGTMLFAGTNGNGVFKRSLSELNCKLAAPTITVSGSTTFCQGGSVTLSSSAAGSYLWSNGDTTQSITVKSSGNYSVTIKDINACSATSLATAVIVNPLPAANAGNDLSVCKGSNTTIGGSPTGPGSSTYSWFPSIGLNSTIIANPIVNPSSTTTYTVTVSDTNGCVNRDSVRITVNPLPIVTVAASGTTTFCPGDSVVLTVNKGLAYRWSNGATTQSIVVKYSSIYTVALKDSNNCSATSAVIKTNLFQTTATMTAASATSFTEGDSVKLTATNGLYYLWNTGDTSASIVAKTTGNYTVQVIDLNGCVVNPLSVFVIARPHFQANGQNLKKVEKIVASDRKASSLFGWSVSVSGSYAIVGARSNPTNSLGGDSLSVAGAAYIFERDSSGSWIQKQKIVASDRALSGEFGRSVFISGNYAIVGAPGNSTNATGTALLTRAGAAYVFERDSSGNWTQKQKIVASDRAAESMFGNSVSLSNNYAIIGALHNGTNSLGRDTLSDKGAAYIFERNSSGNWAQKQKIVASDRLTSLSGLFGFSVSVSDNYAVVGARGPLVSYPFFIPLGDGYIFERDSSGVWKEKQKITPLIRSSKLPNRTDFGSFLSISGNNILVGGEAVPYLYERDNNGIWKEKQMLIPSDETAYAVAVSGNYALVGYGGNCKNSEGMDSLFRAGSVFLFEKNSSGNWIQKQKIVAPDRAAGDVFGSVDQVQWASNSLAISGNYAIVGSMFNFKNTEGTDSLRSAGAAYIFEICPTFNLSQTITICAGDSVTIGTNTYKESGTYTDVFTSSAGCDSIYTTYLTVLSSSSCSFVWPGDANNDGVANNMDLLSIGVAYNAKGSVRPNATLNWEGQPATDWADSLSDGTNDKHVDCNGDGIINISDISAIIKNYGFTHNKTFAGVTPTSSDPTLSLKTASDAVSPGATASVQVELATNAVPASNVYGIAFTVNFDPALVDSASLGFDIANSWMGIKNTNLMAIDYNNFSNGSIDIAITKNDHSNTNGFGTIGALTFKTNNNFIGNKALNLSVSNVKMISNNETDLPVNLGKDAVITTGINAIQQEEIKVIIQPNPFSSSATVFIEGLNSNVTLSFELYDIVGKKVKQIEGINTRQFTISKENLQAGIYFYKVFSSKAFIGMGRVEVE